MKSVISLKVNAICSNSIFFLPIGSTNVWHQIRKIDHEERKKGLETCKNRNGGQQVETVNQESLKKKKLLEIAKAKSTKVDIL